MPAGCRLDAMREQAPLEGAPCHEWTTPEGQLCLTIHHSPGGFILRFPGLADFEVAADGLTARCAAVPGTPPEVHEHLYLNQVRPLMLSRQGQLVFHASAVVTRGGAIAFLGASGRGKSTLAASFAAAGGAFLTDDGLLLDETGGAFRVMPGHASIRLREDSRRELLRFDPGRAHGIVYASKERVPAQSDLPYADRPYPLRAAYFLGEGTASDISLGRLTGAEALAAWIRHAFILDVDDRAWLSAHFDAVSRLTGAVPSYHLDYPRDFTGLGRLRAVLEGGGLQAAEGA